MSAKVKKNLRKSEAQFRKKLRKLRLRQNNDFLIKKKRVSAFSSFTSMSSKRKELFRKHVIEIPQPEDTRWFYRSRTVGVIFEK